MAVSAIDVSSDSLTNTQLQSYLNSQKSSYDDNTYQQIISNTIGGVEGIPYQFMETVDRRIPNTEVGRKYADRIFGRIPLLFLTPCDPLFMDDFTKDKRKDVLSAVIQGGEDAINEILNSRLSKSGRFYTTTIKYDEYYEYLNSMLKCLLAYLNLSNREVRFPTIGTRTLGKMNWNQELNDDFKSYFSARENLVFYLDGLASVSESFTNDTTESSLASQINGFSDSAKEIRFLFGKNGNEVAKMMSSGTDITASIAESLQGTLTNAAGGIIGSLSGKGVNTILNGGKIIFPEIWSNSSFDRSYSINIKLRSPDHDSFSIFMNVLKPYCKLLALTLPKQLDNDDPNGYGPPFLVRAYSKGLFSIDMGIVTSLSVTKGAECCWNDDGLPTQIDIDLEIKDLYKSLVMSKIGNLIKGEKLMASIANNTSYQDFLCTMAGINIAQVELGRKVRIYYYLTESLLDYKLNNIYTSFENKISNLLGKAWQIL